MRHVPVPFYATSAPPPITKAERARLPEHIMDLDLRTYSRDRFDNREARHEGVLKMRAWLNQHEARHAV